MNSRANGVIGRSLGIFVQDCLRCANQWVQEEAEKGKEKSAWAGPTIPLKVPCKETNRSSALKDICASFYKKDSQFEDDELSMEQSDIKLLEYIFWEQLNGAGQKLGIQWA